MYLEAIGPHRFKFNAIVNFCGTYFYKSDTKSMRYKRLRVKHIKKFIRLVTMILSLTLLSYIIVLIAPIYENVYQHIRITPLAMALPFLEKDSKMEFTLNMVLQMIMAFYAMNGSFAIEIATCMVNHAIVLGADLIRFNLLAFHKELTANGCGLKSIAQLRNIFVQLQDYNRFDF